MVTLACLLAWLQLSIAITTWPSPLDMQVNNLASSMEWESGAGPGAGSDAAGHPSGTEAVVPARTPVPQHEMQRMQVGRTC